MVWYRDGEEGKLLSHASEILSNITDSRYKGRTTSNILRCIERQGKHDVWINILLLCSSEPGSIHDNAALFAAEDESISPNMTIIIKNRLIQMLHGSYILTKFMYCHLKIHCAYIFVLILIFKHKDSVHYWMNLSH